MERETPDDEQVRSLWRRLHEAVPTGASLLRSSPAITKALE